MSKSKATKKKATKPVKFKLPPDPEEMNEKRSKWARAALEAFMSETNQVDEVESLGDLACDLLHLGDRLGLPAKELLERIIYNYGEDTHLE